MVPKLVSANHIDHLIPSPPLCLALLSWFARYPTYLSAFGSSQDKYIDREVQTLSSSAQHPNIIDLHGFFSTTSTTFVVMPLVKTDVAKLIQVYTRLN